MPEAGVRPQRICRSDEDEAKTKAERYIVGNFLIKDSVGERVDKSESNSKAFIGRAENATRTLTLQCTPSVLL